jgi:two-component system OmpR family response regulator
MSARVLLLDDDDAARLTLAALLEDEFDVAEVSCLADARASLTNGTAFDLVLLDRHLGDGHGIDLIPLVRSQLPRCKIIVVSGSAGQDDGEPATAADAYFGKGDDPDALFEKIHALLG